jgi:8-hydroxy-5-deazaflavin:NADPH oxidoreductase
MKIGIIGAGHIGGNLARRLTSLGHKVRIANSRGPETLKELETETGATPATDADAVEGAELVILAIPTRSVPELPPRILDARAPGAPIIETTNYYPQQRDGRIDPIEQGMTESRWVSNMIGQPVIKVFNTIQAGPLLEYGKLAGAAGRIALPVAGDDEEAKRKVMELVDDLGFDPLDAGGLDDSWREQPGTPAYLANAPADELRQALADASPQRQPEFSAA